MDAFAAPRRHEDDLDGFIPRHKGYRTLPAEMFPCRAKSRQRGRESGQSDGK